VANPFCPSWAAVGEQVAAIDAMVAGSMAYDVAITIAALPPRAWRAIKADCVTSIGSLVDLLSGRLTDDDLAGIFGIEIAGGEPAARPAGKPKSKPEPTPTKQQPKAKPAKLSGRKPRPPVTR